MYQIGQYIIYGSTGVCKVESLVEKPPHGLYYVLKPLYESGTIYTPAEHPKVFMRPVISRDEAEALIDQIPQVVAQPDRTKNLQELREHYRIATCSHNCADLIRLTMSIYAKKKEQEQRGRRFGQVDERFMKQAESILFGEFAVALGIPKEEVHAYISRRVEGLRAVQS